LQLEGVSKTPWTVRHRDEKIERAMTKLGSFVERVAA
jgi:hypothetical protein